MGVAVTTPLQLVHSHVTVWVQGTQDQHVQVWARNAFQCLHFSLDYTPNLYSASETLKTVNLKELHVLG